MSAKIPQFLLMGFQGHFSKDSIPPKLSKRFLWKFRNRLKTIMCFALLFLFQLKWKGIAVQSEKDKKTRQLPLPATHILLVHF